MPWKKCEKEEAKWKFVQAMLAKKASIAALCAEHGISRGCGYKWWRRFREKGSAGLEERSRRPESAERKRRRWLGALVKVRRRYPRWGVEKLRRLLQREYPGSRTPAARTLGRWLKQAGLVGPRKRRCAAGPVVKLRVPAVRQPNDLWTVDFKGKFRTGDGAAMQTLTVRDAFSRTVLLVRDLPRVNEAEVRRALTGLFRRYGLPRAIRVDNGGPFCGQGPRGWTTLSVWWVRLGIVVVVGRPACPQDNGAHEQMHRMLKADTASPPAANARAQQARFDRWRQCYNQVRPHAALGGRTPASLYRPSPRRCPRRLPVWSYPRTWPRVRPKANARALWAGRQCVFGRAFAGEWLGLRPRPGGRYEVYLGPHLLGLLHPDAPTGLRSVRLQSTPSKRKGGGGRPLP